MAVSAEKETREVCRTRNEAAERDVYSDSRKVAKVCSGTIQNPAQSKTKARQVAGQSTREEQTEERQVEREHQL